VSREILVYLEGGGDQKETRARLRQGFSAFLGEMKRRAEEKGISLRIVPCGGRNCAIDDFQVALRKHPSAFNLLLVDSEGPVTCASPREHLRSQGSDPGQHERVADERCHLMVQTMEAWLIADRERLAEYFGKGFHEKSLPANRNVEAIDKQVLAKCLDRATKATSKKGYDKTRDAPRILETIRAPVVQDKAPFCKRLFVTLTDKINAAAD
jgi:hypothetical protein